LRIAKRLELSLNSEEWLVLMVAWGGKLQKMGLLRGALIKRSRPTLERENAPIFPQPTLRDAPRCAYRMVWQGVATLLDWTIQSKELHEAKKYSS
jgi:hypothetical protein